MHVYAVDIIVTTKISDHNSKVEKNFNKQFKVWKYAIFKCAYLNLESQPAYETVEQFITTQYQKADNYEFGNMWPGQWKGTKLAQNAPYCKLVNILSSV